MLRIFMSYSRKDEPFARQVAGELTRTGIDVWMDVEDIPVGQKWSNAIQQGLDTSDVMLVILSPTSMESANVEDEFTYFLDQKKPVIPLLHQPTRIHFQLGRVQYIDFHGQPFDIAIKRLFEEIDRRQGKGPASMAHTTSAMVGASAQTPLPVMSPSESPSATSKQPRLNLSPAGSSPVSSTVTSTSTTTSSVGEGRGMTSTMSMSSSTSMMRLALIGGLALVVLVVAFLVLRNLGSGGDSITDQRVINAEYTYNADRSLRIKLPQDWSSQPLAEGGLMIANNDFFFGRFENQLLTTLDPGKIGIKVGVVSTGNTEITSDVLNSVGLQFINGVLETAGREYMITARNLNQTTYNGNTAVYAKGSLDGSDYYITLIYQKAEQKLVTAVVNTAPGDLDENNQLVQDLLRSVQPV